MSNDPDEPKLLKRSAAFSSDGTKIYFVVRDLLEDGQIAFVCSGTIDKVHPKGEWLLDL